MGVEEIRGAAYYLNIPIMGIATDNSVIPANYTIIMYKCHDINL